MFSYILILIRTDSHTLKYLAILSIISRVHGTHWRYSFESVLPVAIVFLSLWGPLEVAFRQGRRKSCNSWRHWRIRLFLGILVNPYLLVLWDYEALLFGQLCCNNYSLSTWVTTVAIRGSEELNCPDEQSARNCELL